MPGRAKLLHVFAIAALAAVRLPVGGPARATVDNACDGCPVIEGRAPGGSGQRAGAMRLGDCREGGTCSLPPWFDPSAFSPKEVPDSATDRQSEALAISGPAAAQVERARGTVVTHSASVPMRTGAAEPAGLSEVAATAPIAAGGSGDALAGGDAKPDGARPGRDSFGVDALTPLREAPNPGTHPSVVNGRAFSWWPNGSRTSCSGSMIGPRHLVTAGHCIYDSRDGGWATAMVFVPGYQLGWAPVGVAWAESFMAWTGWVYYGDVDHDMAVARLDWDIGHRSGWFGLAAVDCAGAASTTFNNASYPGWPYSGETMYFRSGRVDTCALWNQFRFNSPSYGGQSGSSFYVKKGDGRYVAAVLSYTTNCGSVTGAVAMTCWRIQQIAAWMGS